jgi:NAD-dependent dihydropyrimidine dehydrogenase PreA subunit
VDTARRPGELLVSTMRARGKAKVVARNPKVSVCVTCTATTKTSPSPTGSQRRCRGTLRTMTDLDKKRRAAVHPDRPGQRCAAEPGAWTPAVDFNKCEGKRDCVVVCPNDVFEVRRIDRGDFLRLGAFSRLRVVAHRGQVAYTPNADQCHACGLCVVACPEKAITLLPPSG